MNLMNLSKEDRAFVTNTLATGTTKGELVSMAVGIAISNTCVVRNDVRGLGEITEMSKEVLIPHLDKVVNCLTKAMPLDTGSVYQAALNHYKTKVVISNPLLRNIQLTGDNPVLSVFSLTSYLSLRELELVSTQEGVDLINGFVSLIMENK